MASMHRLATGALAFLLVLHLPSELLAFNPCGLTALGHLSETRPVCRDSGSFFPWGFARERSSKPRCFSRQLGTDWNCLAASAKDSISCRLRRRGGFGQDAASRSHAVHIGGKRGGGGLTSLRMSSEEGDEQPLLLDRGGSQLTIVVDACNVGLQLQADESGGIASLIQTRQKQRSLVEMLPELERLAAVAAQENHTVTFVFDGKSQFGQYADKTFEIKGGATVVFTGSEESADDRMVRMVLEHVEREGKDPVEKMPSTFKEAQTFLSKRKSASNKWIVLSRKSGLKGSTATKKAAEISMKGAGLIKPETKIVQLAMSKGMRTRAVQALGILKSVGEDVIKVESWGRHDKEIIVITNDVALNHRVWLCGGFVAARNSFIRWVQDFAEA